MPEKTTRWVMLGVICLLILAIGISLQALPPVLSLIIEDLQISHADAGLLSAIANLPGIFLIIPISMLSGKIGIKRLGIFSAAFIILGSIIMFFAPSFPLLLAGRVVMGIGASTMAVIGLQSIAIWFTGYRIGLAMGIFAAVVPLAGLITMGTFGAAGLAWGWRSILLIIAGITAMVLAAYAAIFRLPPHIEAGTDSKDSISASNLGKLGWRIWALAICWGLINIGVFSVFTFMPDYVYRSGFDLRIAGLITSIMSLVGIPAAPILGHLIDKTERKELWGIAGGIICVACLFVLPLNVNFIIAATFLFGVFICPFSVITFSRAPQMVKKELMPLAYGIVVTVAWIGQFIGPYIIGAIQDATQEYRYAFWVLAVVYIMITAILALLYFNRPRERNPEPADAV